MLYSKKYPKKPKYNYAMHKVGAAQPTKTKRFFHDVHSYDEHSKVALEEAASVVCPLAFLMPRFLSETTNIKQCMSRIHFPFRLMKERRNIEPGNPNFQTTSDNKYVVTLSKITFQRHVLLLKIDCRVCSRKSSH